MTAPLFLAAGTVLAAPPEEQIRAAAAAGFDGCGLRLDPATCSAAAVARLARVARSEGVLVLDIEVVRLTTPEPTPDQRHLVAIGADLGARWVLTVSEVADPDDRRRGIEIMAEVAQCNGMRIALEFMGFTAVPNLAAALRLWSMIGAPVGVLIDALHLHRTGGTPAEVAMMPSGSLGYLQLCDVGPGPGPDGAAALAAEARHHRLMPGDGAIDLAALVASVPKGTAVTVEVQNDSLAARHDPADLARRAYAAARRFVSQP